MGQEHSIAGSLDACMLSQLLSRLRQKDCKFEANVGYIGNSVTKEKARKGLGL